MIELIFTITLFCFSSRRRHTRFDCDWSSDVCSSDLPGANASWKDGAIARNAETNIGLDRKSTRLNSSHSQISYAVFCLKKKFCYSWRPRIQGKCMSSNKDFYNNPPI